MCLHRAFDRALAGVRWADTVRASWAWKCVAWFCTFQQLLAGLILVRMQSWADGWLMTKSLFGVDLFRAWSAVVPVWVPLLVGLVVIGHVFSGVRKRECGLMELPSGVRAAVYVAAVVMLVTLAPGVTKTFIYIQF
jgi:hypothetical protein